MPRRREPPKVSQDKSVTSNANTNDKGEQKKMAFTELTPEAILEIQAKSRTRGQYDSELGNFLEAGIQGGAVSLTEGPFAGKKGQSVKTGFEGAVKRYNENAAKTGGQKINVMVRSDDNAVYLLVVDA